MMNAYFPNPSSQLLPSAGVRWLFADRLIVQVEGVDSCVQTEEPGIEVQNPRVLRAADASTVVGRGRLELSLATAVLSMTQRMTQMESEARARARNAEAAAKEALEESKRQARVPRQMSFHLRRSLLTQLGIALHRPLNGSDWRPSNPLLVCFCAGWGRAARDEVSQTTSCLVCARRLSLSSADDRNHSGS